MRPPRPVRRRILRVACLLLTAVGLLTACTAGPDTGPPLVVEGGAPAGPAESAAPSVPALDAPRTDLTWTPCPPSVTADTGLPTAVGVRLDCAGFDVPTTPGVTTQDRIRVAAVRARLDSTPRDAAPLVLTTGADMPSSVALSQLAAGRGRGLLAARPVVAVDRRGLGASSPIDCLTNQERNTLLDNGFDARDAAGGDAARQARLIATASEAADGCAENLSPHQLAYTSAAAAADLERLRERWGVAHLGLVGVGAGADVALAYAGAYPDRVGRIVLDTPSAYLASARVRGQQVAAGTDAALTTFATDCSASRCSLGADARGAIRALLDQAAAGRLASLSDADVLDALTTELALTTTDRASTVSRVSDLLAGARDGAVGPLAAAARRARVLRGTDGQLLSRCDDIAQPVGQNEVSSLTGTWRNQYPITGVDTALSLLRCSGWPAGPAAPRPDRFVAPVLQLTNGYDTINGGTGAGAVTPLLISAGARSATITYDSPGYGVTAHSECAAGIVARYSESGAVPDDGACPS